MNKPKKRPPFIISAASVPENLHQYPNSDENTGHTRHIGAAAGIRKIGVNLLRLSPGERSSWPHAEEKEEEFVYVLDGEVDAWIDGSIHPMKPGDFRRFPPAPAYRTASSTTPGAKRCCWWAAGLRGVTTGSHYPLHPQRRNDLPPSEWWHDAPQHELPSARWNVRCAPTSQPRLGTPREEEMTGMRKSSLRLVRHRTLIDALR